LPTIKQGLAAPSDLIDLGQLADLKGIHVSAETLTIGAMTRHAEVAASAEARKAIPALAHLAGLIGDPQVRNTGTLGGSLANSDPAADYPAAVMALGATIHTNQRSIAAEDYFLDLFETALEPGELIVKVEFPIPQRAGYAKFPKPASRYAIVGVTVVETENGIRVGVTGAGPCAFRCTPIEDALAKGFSAEAVKRVAIDHSRSNSDLHASAEYRGALVTVMAGRAVAAIG
ncbi:MAG: carbon monoxide dehydrogenase, partial [Gammaproteobacteria bacterium]